MAGLISMVSCPSMGVGMGMSKTSCSSGGSWSLQNHNQSHQVAALRVGGGSDYHRRNGRGDIVVRSGTQEEKVVVVSIGQVTEVNKDTFWPLVKAASHTKKIVVLDMYTQWCGPCKVMAPKFKELSEKYDDVVFLKLDCNQENKSLAKELGIKVVPTFKILKDSKIVKEVTGAKFDDLVGAIEIAKSN